MYCGIIILQGEAPVNGEGVQVAKSPRLLWGFWGKEDRGRNLNLLSSQMELEGFFFAEDFFPLVSYDKHKGVLPGF